MEEIDIKELLLECWKKRYHMLIFIIAFLILGIIYSYYIVKPKYESKITLLLAQSSEEKTEQDTSDVDSDVTLNSKLVSNYSQIIKSDNVIREVKSNLNINDDVETLKSNISVSSEEGTEIISITVKGADRKKACSIANEIAVVFKERVKSFYGNLDNVQTVDVATVAKSPYNINHTKDLIMAVGIGFLVFLGFIFCNFIFDSTIKSVEDLENITNDIECLASFPVLNNKRRKK